MSSASTVPVVPSNRALWTGRILSAVVIVFLVMDSVMKLMRSAAAVETTAALGYSPNLLVPLGVLLLCCVALYALPRTSFLGAILLTGYLGGAVATQLRVGNPLFGFILFPVYLGVLIWTGLALRDSRLRVLLFG